jgi:hypothetical protein
VFGHEPVHFSQPALSHQLQHAAEFEDRLVCQCVVDVKTLLPADGQARLPKRDQMLGCVRQREACFLGQGFDRSFTLGKKIKKFDASRIGDRLSDLGELCV